MNGMLQATGVLLFAAGLHRAECMVYHLALLSRHGNHLELQEKVGEIHYQSDASEPQMINEVGCVWQSANSVGNIKKMYLPKDGCLPLLPEGVGVHATGLKLESNDNFTLHVYQSDDKGALTDGYLAIPDEHLGSEYYVNTYCSTGGYCQFAVTGTVDSTSVNVVFPRNIPPGSITCNGTIISTGEPISFILNENDVLHIESTESKVDLSGTYITSNNNVAVFVGARDVPGKDGMPAFMIEQIPPVNKWGTEHVVAPNYLNDAGDIVKIITKDVDTTIHILRFSPFTISNAGETIERRVDWELYSTVKATKPILVIQVMSLDIYNYTSIVHGNPAMVLVPHVEQWTDRSLWTDCLQKTPHKSVLTMTAKKDELSSIPWSPSQDSQYTHSTYINASDYSVLVVRTGASESTERQSMGSKFRALYGYCDGASAVLYDVNWEWENEKCVLSVPAPGDGIDNDCDGKIDEDTCTKDDLAVSFISTQDPGTYKTTYKSIYVKKASPVHFSVKSCGIAKIILQTKAEPIITTSIQITSSSVVIQTCSPACIVQTVLPISVSDCNTKQNYEIHWYRPTSLLVGTEHVFKYSTGEMYTFIIDDKTIDYDVMLLTSFTSPAEFVVDLPDKDCSKVISGEKADNHGTTFLAPFLGHLSYNIYLTNSYTVTAKVRFLKASDKTILLDNVGVSSRETSMQTSASLSNEKVVIIESDIEISVYAIMTTTSSKKIGFSILPVDILGPNYHVYLDSSYEDDSTPDSATLCRGFSFHDNTESNIGPVSNMIDITKGIYNSDLGHQKRITANRPMAVFCGADDNLVQIPPLESLGTQYFIPEIPYNAGSETAEIRLVATEDSTVVIIRGNYDNLDTVEMTGNIFSRKVELKTVYNITSTKPIQVHLLLRSLASPSTWASVTTIPPVQQYKTKHYFPGSLTSMGIGFGLRIGVDEDGQPVPVPGPGQNINTFSSSAGIYVYENKTFPLYFLYPSDGGRYIIAGDMLYEDINKVCSVTVGSPGDGIDNDCDGLVDEEQCTTTITAGEIDADIDGSFNEDCASGTTPFTATNIDLAFTPESVTCPVNSGTGNAGESAATGDISSGNNNSGGSVITINNGLVKMNPPTVTPVLAKPPGSQPTYLPLSASAVAVVVQGTAATTEPTVTNTTKENCVADCICPCGWVNPPKNYTPQELQIVVKEIQEKLRVSKTSLSSVIRSKSSAQDGRTEATAVGIAGIIFIVVLLGAVLLLDLATITRDLRLMANNLRQVFQP